MRTLAIALTCLALSGCSSISPIFGGAASLNEGTSPASGKELEKPKQSIEIDRALLTECPPVKPLKANPLPSDVLAQHEQDLKQYQECASSKSKLVTLVKKAFNIQ